MDIAEIYVKSKIDLPPASRHFCQPFWPLWMLPKTWKYHWRLVVVLSTSDLYGHCRNLSKYVNSLFSTTEQWARMNLLLCFTQNKNIFIEIQMLRDITVLKTFTGWNMNLVLTKRELRPVDNEFADEMAVFWRRLDILKNLAILTSRKRILFF